MSTQWPSQDQFNHIRDLNQLFLAYLRSCSTAELQALDFPAGARNALLKASAEQLDCVAAFPRALFELHLPVESLLPVCDPRSSRGESARQSINVMILLNAWTLARQSVYQARLLLGLESRVIQQLRGLPLGGLHELAKAPRVVGCAFQSRDWLWRELIDAQHAEARRRLALVALQPGLEREWPMRRALPVSS